jgi:hypothetical protein
VGPSRIAIVGRWDDPADVAAAMEVAITLARIDLARGRAGALYDSGVRFARESERWRDAGEERFVLPSLVLYRGVGDCDDLVIWRVAELRNAGVDAAPAQVVIRPGLTHMVVRYSDGRYEDPAMALGMLDGG